MKLLLLLALTIPVAGFVYQPVPPAGDDAVQSPLGAYAAVWNQPRYMACNTASKAAYMTKEEQQLIWILNMMRLNPKLFANTVAAKYPEYSHNSYLRNSTYYQSLMDTLRKIKPGNMLYPDSLCFSGAQCHAITAGAAGFVGHERLTEACKEKWYFNGECCDYGRTKALDIVMGLMIDEDVPSLGHRVICLNPYKLIGVSIQPHKVYGHNAVLDFHY